MTPGIKRRRSRQRLLAHTVAICVIFCLCTSRVFAQGYGNLVLAELKLANVRCTFEPEGKTEIIIDQLRRRFLII